MASGRISDYLAFLTLKKRMVTLETDTANLLIDSQNSKIPQWREINAATAQLMERFKDLKKRVCEFFNQFSLCRYGIHTLDDSSIKKMLNELGGNNLENFHGGIRRHLNELEELDHRLASLFIDLEESRQYAEAIAAEKPRVSVNFAEILEILERIEEDEDNLRKSSEFLVSYWGESLNLEELKEEVEMSSSGLKDFKRRFQAFEKEFFPSGDRNLDPSLEERFLERIDEFSGEFTTVDEYVRYAFVEVEAFKEESKSEEESESNSLLEAGIQALKIIESNNFMEAYGSGVFDLKELQKLKLQPLKQQQKPKLRLPLTIKSGTDHMNLSDILIDMYGFRFAEAHHLAITFARALNLQPIEGSSDTMTAAKENFLKYKSGYQTFQHHIPDALRYWIVHLEAKICNFVSRLQNMLSGNTAASKKLQQWRITLEQFSKSNEGMVPVAVHFITALLEMHPPEESPGLDKYQQVVSYLHTGLENMIDSIHEIVLHLRFVLTVSSITNALTINPNVLDTCELVLRQCEEKLEMLEGRMGAMAMGQGKRNVGEKMKRVDKPIGSCSGGERELDYVDQNQEKSEKARGKRQKSA